MTLPPTRHKANCSLLGRKEGGMDSTWTLPGQPQSLTKALCQRPLPKKAANPFGTRGQKTPSTSRALNTALRHILAIKAANPETRHKPSTTTAMPPSPECIIKNEIGSQGTGYVSKQEVEAYLKSTFGTDKNFSIRVGWSSL
jgi:hypothetical protein